jgi:hypothetical protein
MSNSHGTIKARVSGAKGILNGPRNGSVMLLPSFWKNDTCEFDVEGQKLGSTTTQGGTGYYSELPPKQYIMIPPKF